MFTRTIEGDLFLSPFTGTTFRVKKIYTNTALLEGVEDKNHKLITEIVTLVTFYKKVTNNNLTSCLERR